MNKASFQPKQYPPAWIRLGEVTRLTGWERRYVRKLVMVGVLKTWHPLGLRTWCWYRRSQVLELVKNQNAERERKTDGHAGQI